MKEAGKKSRVIEVYRLIFIDLLCTGVAFGLSAFLRQVYAVNGPLDRRSSLLGCVLSLLCCCLYNILVDGNRDFFRRGKYKEFVAVVKCTVTVMITALVIMFFLHNTYTMSRMVFAVFAVLDVVITSAHAAGAIAMVMVGMKIEIAPGKYLVDDSMLNGVVMMILFTCIISTMVTENAAQRIILRDKEFAHEEEPENDDEKILVPVKYPEYANRLINLAILMRNQKLNRGLVGLNVVYDDAKMRQNQALGQKILHQVQQYAAGSDVKMQTQVRIAANIANGIKHAFKEFQASEILIGMHMHAEVSNKFWGEFHQSLFNGLNRQIIMARLHQPLTTIRKIQVAVPSRAQYEPGFYRWLERLARMAKNLECRITFHSRKDTQELIKQFITNKHNELRADYEEMEHWSELPMLASTISQDHMFVVVTARKGTVSYKTALDRLPEEITKYFNGKNLMIIFPDQFGEQMETMTFAQSQHTEERSAYDELQDWIYRKIRLIKKL